MVQTSQSGPPKLDVGVFDGTHGWLRIRAELDSHGQVTASLTAASSVAHDSLRATVPEMTSYLASESVTVSRIAVHRISEGSTAIAAQAEGHAGGGTAEQSRHESEMANGGDGARRSALAADREQSDPAAALKDWLDGLSRVASPLGLGLGFGRNSGGWVNVCA
jgi:hypothetical protein